MSEVKNEAVEQAAVQAEESKMKLSKVYDFEGTKVSEIDFSGLENLTANDMIKANKVLNTSGNVTVLPETVTPAPSALDAPSESVTVTVVSTSSSASASAARRSASDTAAVSAMTVPEERLTAAAPPAASALPQPTSERQSARASIIERIFFIRMLSFPYSSQPSAARCMRLISRFPFRQRSASMNAFSSPARRSMIS